MAAPATAYMRDDVADSSQAVSTRKSCGRPPRTTVGHFRKDLPHVERAGHGVQQAPQALDALATEELALLERRVLDGERQQIGDGVHQRLILAAERVVGRCDVSQVAPSTCAPWRIVQRICERALASSGADGGAPLPMRWAVTCTSPAGVAA